MNDWSGHDQTKLLRLPILDLLAKKGTQSLEMSELQREYFCVLFVSTHDGTLCEQGARENNGADVLLGHFAANLEGFLTRPIAIPMLGGIPILTKSASSGLHPSMPVDGTIVINDVVAETDGASSAGGGRRFHILNLTTRRISAKT